MVASLRCGWVLDATRGVDAALAAGQLPLCPLARCRADGAKALSVKDLARMVDALGHSVRDVRDRALMLLGFAGAYRSSDLATLNIEHLTRDPFGLKVLLARSKDDQMGEGRFTYIPVNPHEGLCAVTALEAWIAKSQATEGPLFRVIQGSRVGRARIHPRAVSRAIQRAAQRAGLMDVHYSSHSLRRGFATAAHEKGSSLREIQVHGRWGYMSSLARYIDAPAPRALGRVVNNVLDPAGLQQIGDVYAR
jgi:site-specific recombinase XerC